MVGGGWILNVNVSMCEAFVLLEMGRFPLFFFSFFSLSLFPLVKNVMRRGNKHELSGLINSSAQCLLVTTCTHVFDQLRMLRET